MRLGILVLFFPILSYSQNFKSCTFYFTSFVKGKNAPLSQMMEELRVDLYEIEQVVRDARSGTLTADSYQTSYEMHVRRFYKITESMHLYHNTWLAPSRVLDIESSKQDSYLKMYSQMTVRFLEMAQKVLQAYESKNWEAVSGILREIGTFTAEAHRAVDSRKSY